MELGSYDTDFTTYDKDFHSAFCIFEFYLNYDSCFFNRFNNRFFDLILIRNITQYRINRIINLKKYTIEIPVVFFMLRTYYSVYLRRVRYNHYIRNINTLYEYTSIKYLFILLNNPGGKNKTKIHY